ncbi:uncharacterized protein BX663DRAFT_555533 [Cokeromyces recurvatus]|uniref:uncharacterized protein n=1 Tax=Cokeromyces recurvatus TaxID=90255 RepID=UPI00221E8A92|nr:uncharacterized protein BX663DRAFT_555533 [Cokeromyces recurvatus]KAI7898815.1 hypothetical protein BX663DRAFT_555533 [Cokeromyces recurvatus]
MSKDIFYEDGAGSLIDEQGEQAKTFLEEKSFRLKRLTDLRKYIKNKDLRFETITNFAGLQIKKTRVAEFMKEECNLSIKLINRHPLARNEDKNLKACAEWSQRSTKAITTTPSTKATSYTVLGTISANGVVNAPEDKLTIPSGATGDHYLLFLNDTMDIIDEFPEMKGFFIVMDNAPIHVPAMFNPVIAILKGKVKRSKLNDVEPFTSRIIEASEEVPVEHLRNIIQHSLGVWEHNPSAINFYTRQGFYKVGSHTFKLGSQKDTDYIMIKTL